MHSWPVISLQIGDKRFDQQLQIQKISNLLVINIFIPPGPVAQNKRTEDAP